MTQIAIVQEIVTAYLDGVDAEVNELVEGLYVIGSVALGDFRPNSSDIDFVAVTARPPTGADLAGLAHVHERIRYRWRRPFFDGYYVTWEDLAGAPVRAHPGPHTHEGRFHPPARHGRHSPVTWHMLARHGVACRGPQPDGLDVFLDPTALLDWSLDNLNGYWRALINRSSRLTRPFGYFALTPYAAVWVATGVSRIHYTMTTGDITAKEHSLRYALNRFDQRWHRILKESLRIRVSDRTGSGAVSALTAGATEYVGLVTGGQQRPLYPTPTARRRDLLALGDMVIADAQRLHDEADGRRS